MSTSAGLGKLKQATKDLQAAWQETQAVWHDENCRRFEEKYMTPLLAHLRNAERMLAHMAAVLQEVQRDCE